MWGMRQIAAIVVALAGSVAMPARGALTLTDTVALNCRQPTVDQLECGYRWLAPAQDSRFSASLDDHALPSPTIAEYPAAGETTAILFTVDTSDPRRQPVIDAIRRQFPALLDQARPHYHLGLAVFDSTLRMQAPIGSAPEQILAKTDEMAAVGKTTELYRSTLDALKVLADYQADRKVLFVLSDGLAEDFAYRHEDVIARARDLGIPIYSIGYPRSVALSVALQSLRRLSEDTGGRFVQASSADYALPGEFLQDPYAFIDGGGTLRIELGSAIAAGFYDGQRVTLAVNNGRKESLATIPIALPPLPPVVAQGPVPQPAAVAGAPAETVEPQPPIPLAGTAPPSAAIQPAPPGYAPQPPPAAEIPRALPPTAFDGWIWYGTPAAFLIVVVIALIAYGRTSRRRELAAPASVPDHKPFAYLIQQGVEEKRHVIAQTPWRIGRTQNNELCLEDHSVSRQHAEIHRRIDGKLEITDLESMNGVFVNEKKVKTAELNEGDSVDIGDVSFKFTRFGNDFAAHEKTVMILTKTP